MIVKQWRQPKTLRNCFGGALAAQFAGRHSRSAPYETGSFSGLAETFDTFVAGLDLAFQQRRAPVNDRVAGSPGSSTCGSDVCLLGPVLFVSDHGV